MSPEARSDASQADRLKKLRVRLANEFQLTVLLSFGLLAALTISGMAIYRFSSDNLLGGIVNTAIAVAIVAVMIYSLKSRRVRLASLIFVAIGVIGCVVSTSLLGRTGLFWSFVVLWINFLLVSRHMALFANLSVVVALSTQSWLFDSAPEQVTFCVTALLVTGYAYLFSTRFNRQHDRLEELATLDPLTGTGNRRLLQRHMEKAISLFSRNDWNTTLVVMDLDRFKRVNDQFGHEAGDEVLERFCRHVREHLREQDDLYRMGGEEFVLLLPGMGEKEARRAMPELHERLSGTLDGPDGPVAFSAGVATLRPGEDWSRWLARADSAMYEAKRAGRNRLSFA